MNSARKEKLVSSHFEAIFFLSVSCCNMKCLKLMFLLYLLPPCVHIHTITSSSFIPKIIIFVYIQTSGKCLLVCSGVVRICKGRKGEGA